MFSTNTCWIIFVVTLIIKDLLTQIKQVYNWGISHKIIKPITTEEKHKQAIFYFTLKMPSVKVAWV